MGYKNGKNKIKAFVGRVEMATPFNPSKPVNSFNPKFRVGRVVRVVLGSKGIFPFYSSLLHLLFLPPLCHASLRSE